jgi:hypothetical protein
MYRKKWQQIVTAALWMAAGSLAMVALAEPPPPAKSNRTVLRLPFWSMDGEPIEAAKIAAEVNGKPAKVGRWLDSEQDMVLLVVTDLAGDLSVVDPARKALREQIGKLPANVHVALLRAQDGLRVLADPGTARETLDQLIQEMSISGRAGLLNSIEPVQALGDGIAGRARVRVAAVVITDSDITNYQEDYTNPVVNSSDSGDMSRRFPEGLVQEKVKKLMSTVMTRETPLFLVHLRYQTDRLNTAYQTGLLDLAGASGGAAEFCRSVGEIPDAVRRMMTAAVSLMSVEVEAQNVRSKQVQFGLAAEGRTLRYQPRRQMKGR